jgi:hypothetical protein
MEWGDWGDKSNIDPAKFEKNAHRQKAKANY